jgi:hypothetical protein
MAAADPRKQVASFIAKFDPEVARLVRAGRRILRARFRTGMELVYDNYNALAIGWSPTERASDVIVSLAVYASGVNLYFMQGARLADPDHLLTGGGRQGRFVRLATAADLSTPGIERLLAAAVAISRTPMPATGRGRTIIKSVSARQRPRRADRRGKNASVTGGSARTSGRDTVQRKR